MTDTKSVKSITFLDGKKINIRDRINRLGGNFEKNCHHS